MHYFRTAENVEYPFLKKVEGASSWNARFCILCRGTSTAVERLLVYLVVHLTYDDSSRLESDDLLSGVPPWPIFIQFSRHRFHFWQWPLPGHTNERGQFAPFAHPVRRVSFRIIGSERREILRRAHHDSLIYQSMICNGLYNILLQLISHFWNYAIQYI